MGVQLSNKRMATAGKAKPEKALPTWVWSGVNQKGSAITGETDAMSQALLRAKLINNGITLRSAKRRRAPMQLFAGKAKGVDVAGALRQLASMLAAGLPALQAVETIQEATEKQDLAKSIQGIADAVQRGSTLSDGMNQSPQHFDRLTVALVQAGEQSGTLELLLDRIATYKEKTEAIKAKVKKAMIYPVSVITVAMVVASIMLIYVIPKFQTLFSGAHQSLPSFTLFVIHLSVWVRAYGFLGLAALVASIVAFVKLYGRSAPVRLKVDRWLLHVPVIGKILGDSSLARWCRTLATLFTVGVPLVDAIVTASHACGNAYFEQHGLEISRRVSDGESLKRIISDKKGVYPIIVRQMITVGEETGALDDMLERAAMFYENRVSDMVDNLSALMEPMIISVLGVVVGGLVIAMYLPIFNMGNAVGGG